MKKIIIVAMDRNCGIGRQNRLPWQGFQRADMKRFVETTMGFPIIMGRKTYESFPKRPLPGRTNIVLTRQFSTIASTCRPVRSCEEAFLLAKQEQKDKVFILGGAEIYYQTLCFADELRITLIDHNFVVDTFFPWLDQTLWKKVEEEKHLSDAENRYPYSFLTLERIS